MNTITAIIREDAACSTVETAPALVTLSAAPWQTPDAQVEPKKCIVRGCENKAVRNYKQGYCQQHRLEHIAKQRAKRYGGGNGIA